MEIIINGITLNKNPKLINPLHELVNRMPLDMFRYSPPETKISWVNTMNSLYKEAGIVCETLKRTIDYIKFLKDTKTNKEFLFEVDKIFWDYLLAEEGLGTHLQAH